MSEATTALLGVIAGGVVTGGVQYALARSDDRLKARTSARVFTVHVVEVQGAMIAARQLKEWNPPTYDWHAIERAWVAHRDSLATALSQQDFGQVAVAMLLVARVAATRDDHRDPLPPGVPRWDFRPADDLIAQAYAELSEARIALVRAGAAWPARLREAFESPQRRPARDDGRRPGGAPPPQPPI